MEHLPAVRLDLGRLVPPPRPAPAGPRRRARAGSSISGPEALEVDRLQSRPDRAGQARSGAAPPWRRGLAPMPGQARRWRPAPGGSQRTRLRRLPAGPAARPGPTATGSPPPGVGTRPENLTAPERRSTPAGPGRPRRLPRRRPWAPRACASSQSTTRSASSETSSPLWSTRPETSRIRPSTQVGRVRLVEPREDDDLDRALEVLERRDRHRRLGLGDDRPHAGHDPAHHDALLVEGLVAEVARVGGHERADRLGDLLERVVGQVQPEELLLPAQALPGRRLGDRGSGASRLAAIVGGQVEERHLAADPIALGRAGRVHRVVEAGQDLGRVAERGQGADPGQRLEDALVGQAQVDPLAEVRSASGTRRRSGPR